MRQVFHYDEVNKTHPSTHTVSAKRKTGIMSCCTEEKRKQLGQ